MDFNSWNIFWSWSFGILAALIVLGNVLIMWIFLKRRLRKRARFLLISLAVTDLLVGLLSVPLYIAINTALPTPALLLYIYNLADIFTGFTSIFTLAVISLERMYAIGWPLRHRTVSTGVYIFAIITPYVLSAIITYSFTIIATLSFIYVVVLSVTTPLLVMCTAYFVIWRKQKSAMENQNHLATEARLAKTLFLITGASLLTWLPFQILFMLFHFKVISNVPNITVTTHIIKFLKFSNSLVNVIIYPFRISEFKNVLLHYCLSQSVNEVAPSEATESGVSLQRIDESQS